MNNINIRLQHTSHEKILKLDFRTPSNETILILKFITPSYETILIVDFSTPLMNKLILGFSTLLMKQYKDKKTHLAFATLTTFAFAVPNPATLSADAAIRAPPP
jgi:hypothetical protein